MVIGSRIASGLPSKHVGHGRHWGARAGPGWPRAGSHRAQEVGRLLLSDAGLARAQCGTQGAATTEPCSAGRLRQDLAWGKRAAIQPSSPCLCTRAHPHPCIRGTLTGQTPPELFLALKFLGSKTAEPSRRASSQPGTLTASAQLPLPPILGPPSLNATLPPSSTHGALTVHTACHLALVALPRVPSLGISTSPCCNREVKVACQGVLVLESWAAALRTQPGPYQPTPSGPGSWAVSAPRSVPGEWGLETQSEGWETGLLAFALLWEPHGPPAGHRVW